MKKTRKVLAIVLATLMVITLIPMTAFAADYTIELGETITVNIPDGGYVNCKFTPDEDGTYVVYSDMGEADIDPFVAVYDADGNKIADDDDSDYADDTYDFYCLFDAEAGADYWFEFDLFDTGKAEEYAVTVVKFAEITHQPTADEPYVEVTEGADAEYQWYKVGNSLAELTDEYAKPRGDYRYAGNFATYDSANGWTGVYTGYDDGSYKEHNFFEVMIPEDQTIKMTADDFACDFGIWCICGESDEVWEDVNANDTVEFTSDHTCIYNTWGYYEQEPHLKAEMPEMTKVNTDAELDVEEAGTYICVVTFDGSRYEISDEVEISASDLIPDSNKINKADINIRTDIAGMSVNDYEDYIEILTEGLEFEDNYGDPAVYVYDSEDNEIYDGFVSGETYRIYLYLTPESGYKFANTVEGTVNGEETETDVRYWEPGGEYGDVRVDFVELAFEITVTEPCDHMCHQDGFLGFIWSIVNFFCSIFGINPFCECGAAHY